MESSSGESFLWTDASEDSNDSLNEFIQSKKIVNGKSEDCSNHANIKMAEENEENSIYGTTNKRKLLNDNDDHQTETKRIKLEPESDKEVRKKKKRKSDFSETNSNLNLLEEEKLLNKKIKEERMSLDIAEVKTKKKKKKHKNSVTDINSENESPSTADQNKNELEIYLEKRVKEEQMSSIGSEDSKIRKKFRNSNSNFDSATEIQPTLTLNSDEMDNYLNLRVKEEQASEIEAESHKVKKKKKKKRHLSLEMEDTNKSVSLDLKSINTESSDLLTCVNEADTEYLVIEEKFSAEETTVEKRKQKKHKKEKNKEDSSSTHDVSKKIKETSGHFNGDLNDIDTSLQPSDFTCNNIVSSTIINVSTLETGTKQAKHITDKINESVLQHSIKYDKIAKISDRIRFEDDESLSQEPNSSKLSSKLQDFLKINPHLRVEKTHSDCSMTEDDEIWVMRCPRAMNYYKLNNNKVSLGGKCKIKIEGQTFDGVQNEDTNRITLLTNQHGSMSISNLPVKGYICYRKRIPKVHIPQDATLINNQTNFIPLPETKCRHPLFGDKYKKAIEIPMVIAKRLEAAKCRENDGSSNVTKKKKHKKDKNKSLEVKLEENCSQESDSTRKRKKRKYSDDNDAPSKKRKKIKHDPDSPGAWESEKAIEENLFNF